MRELLPSGKRSHRPSLGLALLGHKKTRADVATLLLKLRCDTDLKSKEISYSHYATSRPLTGKTLLNILIEGVPKKCEGRDVQVCNRTDGWGSGN